MRFTKRNGRFGSGLTLFPAFGLLLSAALWLAAAVPGLAEAFYCCYHDTVTKIDKMCSGNCLSGNCVKSVYTDYGCGVCGYPLESCTTVTRTYVVTRYSASCSSSQSGCVCNDDWTQIANGSELDTDSCFS